MKIQILIDYHQYTNIWQILNDLRDILGKKSYLLNGTKSIPYNLLAVELLDDRYSFLYEPSRAFQNHGDCKPVSLSRAEIVALSYALDDVIDCPENLSDLNEAVLKNYVEKWSPDKNKSDFQIWVENELADSEITYTELRDQLPEAYNHYRKKYDTEIKSKQVAHCSVEAS